MNKIMVRLLFLAAILTLSTISSVAFDGGNPCPTCDPFHQNCSRGPDGTSACPK